MSEKLSIVIPVYNEEATISQVLNKVLETKFECAREIIVVNDFSSDRTEEILSKVAKRNGDIRIHSLKKNSGKGAAVRHGIAMAKGTIVAIQDATWSTMLRICQAS
jgi:glycosyltransferase involved in cell wall biosynthesis